MQYLKELIVPYYPTRSLHSQNTSFLVVPKSSKTNLEGKASNYQALLPGNQLPFQVWGAGSLSMFKSELKCSFSITLVVSAGTDLHKVVLL